MDRKIESGCGCLLGMAAGDAMGNTVDKLTWDEICVNYGPNGLLGYDIANEDAQITSYTQLAAFVTNGLILGAARGIPERYPRYVALGFREWYKSQSFNVLTRERTHCWLAQVPQIRRRNCKDGRMADALQRDIQFRESLQREGLGTPEKPVFRSDAPGALTAAVAVGLCAETARLELEKTMRLGAEAVALTHGEPTAFLSGAFLAGVVASILEDPDQNLMKLYESLCEKLEEQFGKTWQEAKTVADLVRHAMALSRDAELSSLAVMTMLGCTTAHECLAGAVYATLIHLGNFDEAMIAAVNHSGRSAAVAALTGAVLGARLGVDALPEFYMESLEPTEILTELVVDLFNARQVMNVFDDDWDQKYVQGRPVH